MFRAPARRGDEGIAPYGRLQGVLPYSVSPSVMAFGHATSLAEGGRAAPAGAGNGFPRQCEHWLGMTGRGQSAGAVDVCRGGRFVRPMGIFFTL